MSGAVGHLMHLYDNRQLTFAEIKDVILTASEGRLEQVVEKLDGANLVFTWDQSIDSLRVARNSTDIKEGGRNSLQLAEKFADRGNLSLVFTEAFSILEKSVSVMSEEAKTIVFGPEGNRWYSLEIIYSNAPVTINYDSNNIVFHSWPVFEYDGSKIRKIDGKRGSLIIEKYINQMQNAVANKNWQVRGKIFVNLQKLSNELPQKLLGRLDEIMVNSGIEDYHTLENYVRSRMEEEVKRLRLSESVAKQVLERCVKSDNCMSLTQLKKIIPITKLNEVQDFVKNSDKLIKSFIFPIERVINDLAVEVLKNVHSALVSNPTEEVKRLQESLKNAVKIIEASASEETLSVLKNELNRLGSIENVTSAIEGIVFQYKGNSYKLTGSFAPMHQIMRILKYGNLQKEQVANKKQLEDLLKIHVINSR